MVISHERSGTHFLMNTLAANFGYISNPWVNLDHDLGLNFHAPKELRSFFVQMHDQPVANVIKSHHSAEFLLELMEYLLRQFHVFYIYRDPRDVMCSCWRFFQHLQWDIGPKTDSVSRFMRSPPCGAALRYQKQQIPTMLQRWQTHVEGWMALSQRHPELIVVQYEALHRQFDATVRGIGDIVGRPVGDPVRPNETDNVMGPTGGGKVGHHRKFFAEADYEYVRRKVGDTMERYAIPWVAPTD